MSVIDYLTSKDRDVKFITKLWKEYEVTPTMYRLTSMLIENAFITQYKKVMMSETPGNGLCKTCNVKNDERHILSWCKDCNYEYIQ